MDPQIPVASSWGQGVAGSIPVSPTQKRRSKAVPEKSGAVFLVCVPRELTALIEIGSVALCVTQSACRERVTGRQARGLCACEFAEVLLAHLSGVAIVGVTCVDSAISVAAEPEGLAARCPRCGCESHRIHSRYDRRLSDTAIGGHPVVIELRARRFFCDVADCTATTFTEQIPNLTRRWARRTPAAAATITSIGLAVAGRAGVRLAHRLGISVGRDTLLRAVRASADRPIGDIPVLGIDDFAIRRGHVYGTVVVDMTTRTPIDILPDRTATTVARWLQAHPGAEVVCRDRAGAYADGIRTGAPDAVQVADRWHLWHNLTGAVEKTVRRHSSDLRPRNVNSDAPASPAPSDEIRPLMPLAERTIARHESVQQLLSRGMNQSAIARKLSLDRRTVRRFARATNVEELSVTAAKRNSVLDDYKPYLLDRFRQGCTDAARLTEEIAAMGYRGSDKTVRRYLHPHRSSMHIPPLTSIVPTVRDATGWLTRRPDRLDDDERDRLTALLTRSPALAVTRTLVSEFAEIMVHRRGADDLSAWLAAADASGEPAIRSFVAGLRRDIDAVTAGLTLPHSSGAVEGHVNRIKMLKRQMYGRANLDLLRKRILHPV